jgi:hypothetical protein
MWRHPTQHTLANTSTRAFSCPSPAVDPIAATISRRQEAKSGSRRKSASFDLWSHLSYQYLGQYLRNKPKNEKLTSDIATTNVSSSSQDGGGGWSNSLVRRLATNTPTSRLIAWLYLDYS